MNPSKHVYMLAFIGLAWPLSAYADGYDRVAAKLVPAVRQLEHRRIAVLSFPYIDKRVCSGPQEVQERLAAKFVSYKDLQVVERAAMGEMVEEISRGYQGLLDQRSSYQLGRILDVDAVLTGTLVELPDSRIQINARLIRIPDGLIMAAAEGLVDRTWKDPSPPPERPSIGRWLKDVFAPTGNEYHQEEKIGRFIQEQFDALNALAPTAVRPSAPLDAMFDGSLLLPLANHVSDETPSKELVRGRWLYEQSCTYCHGPQGRGSQAMAEVFGLSGINLNLDRKPLQLYTLEMLRNKLKGGETRMPVYQKPLSDEDAASLLQYLRHMTSALDCTNARERVDRLEEDILELKARYWADRLSKAGVPVETASESIFSVIGDPLLKLRLRHRLKQIYDTGRIKTLTVDEVKRFVTNDNLAFSLHQSCGL